MSLFHRKNSTALEKDVHDHERRIKRLERDREEQRRSGVEIENQLKVLKAGLRLKKAEVANGASSS